MSTQEIIALLKQLNVVPVADGEQLKLTGDTGGLSQALMSTIQDGKQELLSFLRENATRMKYASIERVSRNAYYEVSDAQKRIWLLCQREGGNAAYNIVTGLYLKGAINPGLLDEALKMVVAKHESLHTVFKEVDFVPCQFIVDEMEISVHVEHFRGTPLTKEYILEKYQLLFRSAFDLENGPLLRIDLLQVSPEEAALFLTIHHIISDGWSIALLLQEILYYYGGLSQGETPFVRPTTIQYKDYVDWLSQRMNGTINSRAAQFWTKEYAEPVSPMNLPADFSRPGIKNFEGGICRFYWQLDMYSRIRRFCKEQQVTVFNFFRTTLSVLLYKLSGYQDIVIGTPISVRNHYDLEEQLGLYVNTLPLRSSISDTEPFLDCLKRISLNSKQAFEFQEYPLDKIIEHAAVQTTAGRDALFDVLMVVQNNPSMSTDTSSDIMVEDIGNYLSASGRLDLDNVTAKFDLSFNFSGDTDNRFYLEIEYATGLYRKDTIVRLYNAYRHLISQVLDNPRESIKNIQAISPEERDQLLYSFNDTAVAYPREKTVADLFTEQAALTPDKTALIEGDTRLTYNNLNKLANQVARYLTAHYNIGVDDLVGVQLERSEWQVICLLGILKAGGAYVPVDPDYPQERIDYMLADSGCKAVLDAAALKQLQEVLSSYDDTDLPPVASSNDLIYVMYTSGSTGRPKGCMLEHRSIVSRLFWMWGQYGLNANDIILQKTSFTFDVSILELFLPLCFGASTVLCPKEDAGSPERLLSLIRSENITCVHFVPSMLNSFLNYGFEADTLSHAMNSVTKVMASGEALTAGTVERWYTQLNIPLHNLYGPTESAIEASACVVHRGDHLIPIGRPIWNTQLYILGFGDQPTPIGVTGEICIGGDGLARGYLNNATLTAEKFVPNPFRNGERIYRTGDVGYWRADGTVVYTGRKDDQVKVRGFRIEPAEIEHALQEYKSISDAVVLARTGNDGTQEIIAYVVGNAILDITDLKSFLAKRLPAYMLPAWYVKLEALPLNASGKVDKRSLPAPDGMALAGGAAYIAPRNNTEAQLVLIWSTVLGINESKISVTDSFFSLGGHSLKATRLASLIYRHFDVKFILKELFTYDILEQQAKLIQKSAKAAFTSILPVAAETSYALSAAQRRLWILSQLESGNVAYNVHGVCLFAGVLNISALELAFNKLINRHEILRTAFRENEHGEVRQFISAETNCTIAFTDIRGKENELKELLIRDGNHVFDFSTGSLLRVAIYQLADDKSIFSLLMHHIVSDGWSMGVLIKELQQLYNGDDVLSPLRIQYKDYAHWQAQQLSGKILEEHRAYWLQQFAGELPVLELPGDKARPVVKSFTGGKKSRLLNAALSAELKQLVKQQDATLFMGLLAAVNTLLFRYTGQADIITGTPVAGREHIDLEDQIGFYVNTLALRSRFTGSDSFETFLASIREHTLEAFAHQAYPFDVLVDELNLPRHLSRHPLFDVMVVLHNEETDYASIWNSGTGSSKMEAYNEELPVTSRFDWQFDFTETDDTINVELTYNSDIYNENRINRLLVHLENLLTAIVSAPATALDQLQYLTAEEEQALIYSFNETAIAYPREKTIVDLFTEQVALAPAKTALVCGDARLTYGMLNQLSNRVGHYLREQYNIGADDLVAVQLERSEWQVICLLGVLKAGGAYVPIDPTYPQDRIDYILADSKCKTVLNAAALEQLKNILFTYDDTDLPPVAGSNNLMYVIYTSGSTGRPKGCMLEHRGAVNRLNWMWHHYGFNSDDIILQKTSFTFDVSVWELFLPLCFGASEVLCPQEDVGSPEKLLSIISSEHITCLHFVPSMLNSFLSYGFKSDVLLSGMSSVTKVMASGEALTAAAVERWYQQLQIPLHNLYGPTEASIDVTAYSTSRGDQLIPIGRPIWNTQVYILGAGSQLSPVGVQGEICIGGDGLARGYLNNAALTAEKFVPHPFRMGEKIYLTGDLGYWQQDGTIVYTGRKDDQVKIRGYRVEIGEIEHVLQQYNAINNAVVVARIDSDGEKELIAYVVSDFALDIAKLKHYLGKSLPAYMIPVRYVQLDALPLNASGKTDRRSLPTPEGLETASGVNYVAPRNEIEQQLARVWSELLGINLAKIGLHSSFFDLGGHSLKATRLVSQIYREFQVKLQLKDIFAHPVLLQQAQLLSESVTATFAQIPLVADQSSYRLSSSQRRLWVLSQFESGNIAYNIPGAYVFEGQLDRKALELSFSSLIDRHEILRTVFRENEEGEVRQYIQPTIDFKVHYKDLRENDDELPMLLKYDHSFSFELENGPLMKAALYQLQDDKWVFSFVMHHIISDGWSIGVLISDLLYVYNSAVKKEDTTLPPLRIQYKDYAHWQEQQLSGKIQEEHRSYWLQQFSGELPVLDLPGTKIRPAVKTYAGSITRKTIDAQLCSKLKQLTREQDATLFMALLAAVNTLLFKYTGQEDIIIGTPVANRDHTDIEPQIGLYANTLALRSSFNSQYNYIELLSLIREQTLEAYTHAVYPFDTLVEELQVVRDLSRNALFEIEVILQNADENGRKKKALTGLTISDYEALKENTSRFDLVFDFMETDNGLDVTVNYNTDIYPDSLVEQLLKHLEQLLAAIVSCPSLPISQLNCLASEERNQLLVTFNNTNKSFPANSTIISQFEEQVQRNPNRLAVSYGTTKLSYRELDERSNQLAHYLKANYKIGPNELAGIMLNRSEKLIIAILGILKSGAAYVPIDPAYPAKRKAFILTDTDAKVLITESEYIFDLDYYNGAMLAIDIQLEGMDTPISSVDSIIAANDLAYVIYTSGSTGAPKGVMIEHGAINNTIFALRSAYEAKEGERHLQFASASFDASIAEIFVALCAGASLYIQEDEKKKDPLQLVQYIVENDIDIATLPPAYLKVISVESIRPLKRIVSAGEAALLDKAISYSKTGTFYNGYGPTEAGICAAVFHLNREPSITIDSVPIGRPIANARIYIVDKYNSLVPVNVPGEICIAGRGLARGYLNQPALTTEKFIPDPFCKGERIYRTGDLGYWQADGTIVYVGRKDDQVKIHGYRIELKEIERVLQQHENINAAVAIIHTDSSGDQQLIAYITGANELDPGSIRNWLDAMLPAYMIPDRFIPLDALPLNTSGKIDKKALPLPGDMERVSDKEYIAPRNDNEYRLAEIWSEVLSINIEKIGIKDDFFELGGHSLRAARLANQLHKKFSVKVELQDIFSHSILENQASLLSTMVKNEFSQIPEAPVQDAYVLSSSQRRLWVLSQFKSGNVAYNVPGACVFEGQLNRPALQQAFDSLISRHEILRTVFREDEQGNVLQVIMPKIDFKIACFDIRHKENELPGLLTNAFSHVFDLSTGPLLRAGVYQLADDKWVVSFVMHHIISDGWSMGVLIKELQQLYNGDDTLPPLRIQYKDYAHWQAQQLSGKILEEHRSYWLQRFAGELPVLDLPGTKIRPAIKTYAGSITRKTIDAQLCSKLKQLTREQDATLFMALLAAVNTLLLKYTGQEDIIIGTPVANRDHADMEPQIGLYANTLALRSRFNSQYSYIELLSLIREQTLEAYTHAVYPFDTLVEELQMVRDLSRNALFEIEVILQNADENGRKKKALTGLTISDYEALKENTSRFDLVFDFMETDNGLDVAVNYNTDIYPDSLVEQLLKHLEQLLAAIVSCPSLPISQLNYLNSEERNQLLVTFNNTDRSFPANSTIISQFEEQVQRNPNRLAVSYGTTKLSYRELDERSNQLAHYLKANYKIGPNELVGIMLNRSDKLIIAILGILKSGAAYVPIEPVYPATRKAFILNDTGAKVLITESEYLFDLDYYSGAILAIDIQMEGMDMPVSTPGGIIGANDLAYVIYTSGSTGTPKGVMIEHGAINNTILALIIAYEIKTGERHLQLASSAFDASTAEIFMALCVGSSLYIPEEEKKKDPLQLVQYIIENNIDQAVIPPPYLKMISVESIRSLKSMISAGEAAILDKGIAFSQSGAFYNGYGPTESGICAAVFNLNKEAAIKIDSVPIGRPIANTRIYILDKYDALLPVNIPGEICIAGRGLARGYLNQPSLTNDKFTPDPFREGEKIYRTGDFGYWQADGTIVYAGRKDDQVKVRGHRIELGEVERALELYEHINTAVVIAHTDEDGDQQLVAYITGADELNAGGIRNWLNAMLPAYMIPDRFIQSETLSLNSSGKVDRRALPLPGALGMNSGKEYIAPRNYIESRLVEIWSEVLGVDIEKIGIKDDFFELGGHSLRAARLANQLHKKFSVKVELQDIFSHSILENQASLLSTMVKTEFSQIPEAPVQDAYVLSSSQRRLWVLSQFKSGNVAYNNPGACVFEGQLNRPALQQAFDLLINRHEILRTVLREDEQGNVFQLIMPKIDFKIAYFDIRGKEDELSGLLTSAFGHAFDLSKGPLLGAGVFQLADDKWVFSFVMHHIISDGWSMGVLIKELQQLYNGDDVLSPLRIQYKDYAHWQAQQLSGKILEEHRAYWLQQFAGELPVLELPGDKARPVVKSFTGGKKSRLLNAALSAELKQLVKQQDATLFMGLLAAVNTLLFRYTGQADIITGTPVAGREHIDLEDQIGFYVNTLALRSRFTGSDSFETFLASIREHTLEAFAHQAYPFDVLVDELNLPRHLSRHPLFDVMVVLHNEETDYASIWNSGTGSSKMEAYNEELPVTSRFDWQFDFTETDDTINVELTYNSDIYNENRINRLLVHLENLLTAIVSAPATALDQLQYLTAEEEQALIYSFNETAIAYPREKTIVDLFTEQVALAPAKTALVCGDARLTYGMLNQLSNRVGHYLREQYNIGADDLVAVQLERSEWQVICLLGVLKAGGAYVPIDPTYPQDRIDYILADSKCKTVLNAAALEQLKNILFTYDDTDLPPVAGSNNLMYVIYTSGSTGRPKGCMLEHRGAVNRLNWMWHHYGFNSDDIILQKTSFTFDVSVWELFLPLCFGASEVLCPQEDVGSPEKLLSIISSEHITCLHFVPSMLNSFLSYGFKSDVLLSGMSSVTKVMASGEALTAAAVERWYQQLQIPLHNLYGPTEASIDVTAYSTSRGDQLIPIGRPIWNTQVYILGAGSQLSPVGVQGEICIGGDGLARGYLNNAALTAEKFVPHPFRMGEKIYLTGDLGYWQQDGTIVYTGRKDDQVKIRGYRVEIGEIEHVLQQYNAINNAVVVARIDSDGEKELIAYVVSDFALDIAKLKHYLGKSLPAYMIPVRYVQLDALPLNASGKTDRRSLPASEGLETASGVNYVAPRNEIEQQLVQLWSEVLGINKDKIGVKDNFFDLGAHSLKAVRLISRINATFLVRINIQNIFTEPTIENLCLQIEFFLNQNKQEKNKSELVQIDI